MNGRHRHKYKLGYNESLVDLLSFVKNAFILRQNQIFQPHNPHDHMTDSVQSKSKGSDSSSALDRRGTLLIQDDENKSKRKSHRQKYLSKLGLEGVENLSKYENSEEDGSDDELTVKYSVQILGTDLRKIKGEKSFTVRVLIYLGCF